MQGAEGEEKIRCDACGKSYKRRGYPRHRSACLLKHGICAQDAQLNEMPEEAPARVYKAKRKECPRCGIVMAATNISRHIRQPAWVEGLIPSGG